MHTIKDAIVNIFELLIGKDDTDKCRRCEMKLQRYFGMDPAMSQSKINRNEPKVTYSLSTKDITLADQRAESIITPVHIDFAPTKFFSKASGLKSHDWKQVHTILCRCNDVLMYVAW